MESVNGRRGVTPPFAVLPNGTPAAGGGPPLRADGLPLPASSAGLAVSAAATSAAFSVTPAGLSVTPAGLSAAPAGLSATPAGLSVTPAGLSVTPAGLSVTPAGLSGAPASLPGAPAGLPMTSGRQSVPALSRSPLLQMPPLPASGVIFSRNRYGQVTMTSQPTNESELQLYRVLQHANLLSYYDVFISQGGDDVQQLCEAGEDEFLEIMALVGMASKPLHVRRLQKALQEWVSSPGKFHLPILPVPAAGFLPGRGLVGQVAAAAPAPAPAPTSAAAPASLAAQTPARTPPAPAAAARSTPPAAASPTPSLNRDRESLPSPGHSQSSRELWPPRPGAGDEGGEQYPTSGSPLQLTPTLRDSQIRRLADTALHIAKTLPDFEPRQQHSSKRKACKELEYVLGMDPDDPKRMDKIREYAAIYGRFDCKRKAEKPLTLHEVSVNEAAAQICLHVPALLTRRDELFPLARQVVRNSGYQYSKGHSRSQGAQCFSPRDLRAEEMAGGKRLRRDSDSPPDSSGDMGWRNRQDRLDQIADELRQLMERAEELRQLQERGEEPGSTSGEPATPSTLQQQIDSVEAQQRQLLSEQSELLQDNKQSYKSCMEFYDDDSQYSLSSAASPPGQGGDNSRDAEASRENPDRTAGRLSKKLAQETLLDEGLRVARCLVSQSGQECPPGAAVTAASDGTSFFPEHKVIASAAGTIIAVANPALSMSQLLQPANLAGKLKTEPCHRVKLEPPGSPPPATNGRRPAD